jgi:hypothetical protein
MALAAVVALGVESLAMQSPGPAGVPVRPLGASGASISIVGFGGCDTVVDKTEAEAIAILHEAIDSGITFGDNAWEYHDGRSEEVMGKAFDTPARRDKVFLMTKICARDYEGARRQIDESLRRLRAELRQMVAISRGITPLTGEQVASLLARSKSPAADGRIEEYKNPRGGYGCSYHAAVLKSASRLEARGRDPRTLSTCSSGASAPEQLGRCRRVGVPRRVPGAKAPGLHLTVAAALHRSRLPRLRSARLASPDRRPRCAPAARRHAARAAG